jgi:DHA1 family multidrug resistance protein-like MFS transporter
MVSAAVGPIVGGFLAGWIGIRATCLVSSACGMTALVLINRLYRDETAEGRRTDGDRNGHRIPFRMAAACPAFWPMVAVMFLVSFVERSFSPVVPLYILTLGTSLNNAARMAGTIISLGLFAEAISATVLGSRLRKTQPRTLLLWRLAGGALVCLPMGLVSATAQLLALRIALGLLAGGCMVVVYTLGSRMIPAETRATSFSFLASAALLGGATGPSVAGALTHISIRAVFFFNAFLFFSLWLVALKTLPRRGAGES